VETKTDDIDIITLPGYKFVMKNRKKITKNRSGGIMVCLIKSTKSVSVAVLALKSPKRHIYLDVNRISMDKSKIKLGNLLLHFCKGNSIFIVNGRVGNDKNIGRFTCRNASVVDYCITSPELLKLFFDFDILESSKLLTMSLLSLDL
jgi:hypothetical protein